ncbi:MAG: site-specific DNA-methyltransferase [Bryobacterales bacterium]|nr:site-specific DNA-methyltransferase [Bryobacterales bacterium]
MKPITAQDPESKSPDLVAENVDRLKALFPEAFTEGKIDFEVLKQLLGGNVEEREEKYGLNWHGKRRARQLALTPSTGTLRPCPEESVDWDTTQNLMIEGDNLEVLKLLQKSYAGKVKLIYIDPPYNTGKDFVYPDDFQDNIRNYLQLTGQVDANGRRVSSNTEASGRFHTDWLNMMYPRLKLARNLLRGDGAIFVSIADQEVSRVRLIMDEIFGEENFVATIVWQKKQSPQNDAINLSDMHDYVVVYARQARLNKTDLNGWLRNRTRREASQEARYENRDNDVRGDWTSADLTCNKTADERPNLYFSIRNPNTGEEVWPNKTRVWAYERPAMEVLINEKRIWWGKDGTGIPRMKTFRQDVDDGVVPSTWWPREFAGDNQDARRELRALFPEGDAFDTPKPVQLIRRIIELSTRPDSQDIVLDFFAGAGTVGHAIGDANAEDGGNRRYIVVQLPGPIEAGLFASIAQVTKERLRRAAAMTRRVNPMFAGDLGFRVFKLASSNIRAWDPNRDDIPATLEESIEHLKTDRTEQDILFELLLKRGLELTVPVVQKTIAGKTVYSVGAGTLLACLAEKISATEVEALALGIVKWRQEQAAAGETTIVFRDSAFADDIAKTNLTAILQQHGLGNVRSL